MEIIVEEKNERIDKYLGEKLNISRSKVQSLINNDKVLVNDKVINNSYKVIQNDVITVNDDLDFSIKIEGENIPLDIVYEDDYLLVINKKSGMVTHPAPGNYKGTLVNALIGKYKLSNDLIRPGIVHRLDKNTSGLMLVAKDDKTHELLANMIKNREVKRTYIALVDGTFNHETGTIDAPIGHDSNNREKMTVTDVNCKEAITNFKVIERFAKATLIECYLETGRTHQIRVHMAYINHPVVNDPLYGKLIDDNDFGQLLHSTKISFDHPITHEHLEFKRDVPKEFNLLMEKYLSL